MLANNLQFHPSGAFVVSDKIVNQQQFFADIAAFKAKLHTLKSPCHVVLFHPDTYEN